MTDVNPGGTLVLLWNGVGDCRKGRFAWVVRVACSLRFICSYSSVALGSHNGVEGCRVVVADPGALHLREQVPGTRTTYGPVYGRQVGQTSG